MDIFHIFVYMFQCRLLGKGELNNIFHIFVNMLQCRLLKIGELKIIFGVNTYLLGLGGQKIYFQT